MPPQHALDHLAHVGLSALFHHPVDGGVLPDSLDQVQGNLGEDFVAEHLDRTVVGARAL